MSVAGEALRVGGVLYLFTRWDVYPVWAPNVAPPLALKNLIVWVKDNWSAGDLAGDFGNQHEMIMMLAKGKHRRRGRRWSNVWTFPRVASKHLLNPTQKPVELVQRAIEASSDPGDLVVDPFCGSGTTGAAAIATGRSAILGDIDPRMVQVTCARLGIAIPDGLGAAAPESPPCPVFGMVPPDPSLWGVHPEDLAYALGRDATR